MRRAKRSDDVAFVASALTIYSVATFLTAQITPDLLARRRYRASGQGQRPRAGLDGVSPHVV
jgi:hypothetical protein